MDLAISCRTPLAGKKSQLHIKQPQSFFVEREATRTKTPADRKTLHQGGQEHCCIFGRHLPTRFAACRQEAQVGVKMALKPLKRICRLPTYLHDAERAFLGQLDKHTLAVIIVKPGSMARQT
jgi:hypothetical protein